MPTTNSGANTEHWVQCRVRPDGSAEVDLSYTKTANGQGRGSRRLDIPASSSAPILDQYLNTVAAGGAWSALATAITNFISALNTAESNAAGAGNLDI